MEVIDAEALPLLAAAVRAQGSLAAGLALPDQATAFRERVAWLRDFCAQRLAEGTAAEPDQALRSSDFQTEPHQAEIRSAASAGLEHRQNGSAEAAEEPTIEVQHSPARMQQLLRRGVQLPDLSDAALLPELERWAAPVLAGARSLAQARAHDWHAALRRTFCPSDESCIMSP